MADSMFFSNFAVMKKIIITIITTLLTLSTHAQLVQCEDTCQHVHGIDLSHYQGNVFWETVGDNTKMAYVYLKATEGGTNVDSKYKQNIDLAHRYGLKVGSYHFYRARIPQQTQLKNFMAQCRPGDQDLLPMIDVETKSGMDTEQFCDSWHCSKDSFSKLKRSLSNPSFRNLEILSRATWMQIVPRMDAAM